MGLLRKKGEKVTAGWRRPVQSSLRTESNSRDLKKGALVKGDRTASRGVGKVVEYDLGRKKKTTTGNSPRRTRKKNAKRKKKVARYVIKLTHLLTGRKR